MKSSFPTAGEESAPEAEKEEPEAFSEEELSALLVTEGDTELTEAVKKKAEELGTPLAVYNYLKNNIGYEFYYGSRKGAAGTLDAMGGNDLDQASLLIAMLRHLGMEAEYVRGTIYLTEEQAVSLTGADNIIHASDVLAAAGTPVTCLTLDGEVVQLSMEHVWVRAHIPYTDYRGAGNASGDKVWIDLDTGIKDYEAVTNIYDTLDEEGFSEQIQGITESGDTTGIESLLSEWEERLESEDLSDTYARKRIIKQEEVSYLPLSLQYTVEQETGTFTQVADSEKDSVSFEIGGEVLASFKSSDIQGKDILLSFKPASSSDQEIFDSYSSIFDVPAYAVYMKPVLLVDGKVAAEGEEYLETTLGTKSSFTIHISSGGQNTSVTNDVTTGSMYIVTNPETGAGAYMISGGLNGGSTSEKVTLAYMADIGFSIWDMAESILLISNAMMALAAGATAAGGVFLVLGVVGFGFALYSYIRSVELMCAYVSGDEEEGQQLIQDIWMNMILTVGLTVLSAIAKPIIRVTLKNKLVRELGEDFVNRMLRETDDITELGKYIKQLRKMKINDDVIKEFADKFGKDGLDWLLSKKNLGLTDDLIRKLLKADHLDNFTDDVLKALKNLVRLLLSYVVWKRILSIHK